MKGGRRNSNWGGGAGGVLTFEGVGVLVLPLPRGGGPQSCIHLWSTFARREDLL